MLSLAVCVCVCALYLNKAINIIERKTNNFTIVSSRNKAIKMCVMCAFLFKLPVIRAIYTTHKKNIPVSIFVPYFVVFLALFQFKFYWILCIILLLPSFYGHWICAAHYFVIEREKKYVECLVYDLVSSNKTNYGNEKAYTFCVCIHVGRLKSRKKTPYRQNK